MIVIIADVVVISFYVPMVFLDQVFQSVNVVVEIHQGLSCCFKGDHHFSLGLHTLFVLILVPNFFPNIEIIDVIPEIASWNFSFHVIAFIVVLLVIMMAMIVVMMVVVVIVMVIVVVVMVILMVVVDQWGVVSILVAKSMSVVMSMAMVLNVWVFCSVVDLTALDGCVRLVPVGLIAVWVEIPEAGLRGSGNSSK